VGFIDSTISILVIEDDVKKKLKIIPMKKCNREPLTLLNYMS